MCDGCGCSHQDIAITRLDAGAGHHHHEHVPAAKRLQVEEDVLSKNSKIASANRSVFKSKGILALNLMSSPGSGKTTILEKSIQSLGDTLSVSVIEGDQQTMRDAERIGATGADVVQVNTGTGCHLDADMVHKAMHQLSLVDNSLLFIENVGNLVCPALFDLGEAAKVVIISVTEGEDKPQKYPHMFHAAQVCLINKTDLLPYVDFSVEHCIEHAQRVNPNLHFFELSAKTSEGMDRWYMWLQDQLKQQAVAAQKVS